MPWCSQGLLTVDDPAMPGPRCQGVRDETPVLCPRDELVEVRRLWCGSDVDLERRLDRHERIEPVLALRDRSVCAAHALRVETGAPCRVVHARERAAHEPGEHEVLCPPFDFARESAPAECAASVARTVDCDVEVEDARTGRHFVSLSGAIRAVR